MNEELQSQEVLIGDMKTLDHLATLYDRDSEPSELQKIMEKIISEKLTEEEQQLFYMRFGEQLPFRQIARRMGYKSHQTFQLQIQKIINKVRTALEEEGWTF